MSLLGFTAYFTAVLLAPDLTVGRGRYRITTPLFLFPFLASLGFFLYTVPGNLRDEYNVWSEVFRIAWYGMMGVAVVVGAYTLKDDYDGKGRWLLLLKPHYSLSAYKQRLII